MRKLLVYLKRDRIFQHADPRAVTRAHVAPVLKQKDRIKRDKCRMQREFPHKCLVSKHKRVGLFRVRSFSGRRRERASALRVHEQPCLFVLSDWKWRRAETKTITCVCQRDCAVVESQRPPASDPPESPTTDRRRGARVGRGQRRISAARFGFMELVS